MRVLIVEDELRMASLIRRGLVKEGLAADVAGDGEDALWMAGAHDYDAIVLDVMLPGHRRLRGLPAAAGRRRVVAGADADRARRGRGPRRRARQPAPTTTSSSRSRSPSCSRACARSRAAASRAARGARGRRPAARSGDARGAHAGRRRSRCPRRSSRCWRRSCAGRARCSRGFTCSSTRGTSPTRTARTSSTSTSAACGAKIDEPVRSASRSRPFAAPATGCGGGGR